MTGKRKAALLLMALGSDVSAGVLKQLKETEMELLTMELFSVQQATREVTDAVMEEAYQMSLARTFITQGGVEYARDLLSQAIGRPNAEEMISRLISSQKALPFDFLKETDPGQLVDFIQNESPQTVALILAHLRPPHAAAVLSRLPTEIQADVAMRIAEMDRTPPEVIGNVESVLKKRLSMVLSQDLTSVGGIEYLVRVLNQVDRGAEKTILGTLEETQPDVANEIRKMMFTFDDISKLDDRSLRRVLREVDMKDLALALKAASEDLKAHIFKNMSSRAAEMIQEEITTSGPVRLRNVEEAQQRIVTVIRRLEEAEEIVLSRAGEDVLI